MAQARKGVIILREKLVPHIMTELPVLCEMKCGRRTKCERPENEDETQKENSGQEIVPEKGFYIIRFGDNGCAPYGRMSDSGD